MTATHLYRWRDPIEFYDANSPQLCQQYESVEFGEVHKALINELPDPPALILDLGAGSGRDASSLAALGYNVVAVEPSQEMREFGIRNHSNENISWIDDHLPTLETVKRLNFSYDVVILSAIWMHLRPDQRSPATRSIVSVLKGGAFLYITFRMGPADPSRGIYEVSPDQFEKLAQENGLKLASTNDSTDSLGRSEIYWVSQIYKLRRY